KRSGGLTHAPMDVPVLRTSCGDGWPLSPTLRSGLLTAGPAGLKTGQSSCLHHEKLGLHSIPRSTPTTSRGEIVLSFLRNENPVAWRCYLFITARIECRPTGMGAGAFHLSSQATILWVAKSCCGY